MAWDLGSWLVFVRSLQLLGTLVSGSLNGFLLAYIVMNKLGESQNMVCLEWIICVLLCYTALNLLVIHTGGRSSRTSWLVYAIVLDVVCCGADLAIITLLARAGVPSNCAGLTRSDMQPGDAPFDHNTSPLYSTNRFSDESLGHKGMLDKFCALERAYYFVAIAIMFSYTTTIVLTVLRICEGKYTSHAQFNGVLNRIHGDRDNNAYEMADKLERSTRSASQLTSPLIPQAPASEGITSPRMLSTRPPSLAQSHAQLPSLHHHISHAAPPPRIPVSPVSPLLAGTPPSTASVSPAAPPPPPPPLPPRSTKSPPPPLGLGIASDDSQDALAAAATITDGSRFHGAYQPGMSTLPPYSPASPGSSMPTAGRADEINLFPLGSYGKGETSTPPTKDYGGG